jgi:uncharacterized protein (TIGR02147 family)
MTPSQVFIHADLRSFLESAKGTHAASFEELSRELGVASRTRMKRMFKGSIPMPKAVLMKLGGALGLQGAELEYLDLLRKFEQVRDPEVATAVYRKVIDFRRRHRPPGDRHPLDEAQLRLHEHWYTMPVLYCLDLAGVGHDPESLARAFHGKLTEDQVRQALATLVDIGLLRKEGQRLEKVHRSTVLLDHVPRPLIKKYHSMVLEKAQESIFGIPEDKRFLMAATLAVREASVPRMRARIEQFLLSLNEEFSSEAGDSIQQVAIQLYNLAAAPAADQG